MKPVALVALQEKEKLYLELKSILARQPGPEAAEQLSLYQVSCGAAANDPWPKMWAWLAWVACYIS